MSTNATTQVKDDASTNDYPLAKYAISETTVKRARWENLQVAPCENTNHCNVCNYSHPIAEKAAHTHTVTIEHGMPIACTCKAFEYNEGLCKHCLACANAPDAIETADADQTDATDTTDATALTDGGQDTTVDPDAETGTQPSDHATTNDGDATHTLYLVIQRRYTDGHHELSVSDCFENKSDANAYARNGDWETARVVKRQCIASSGAGEYLDDAQRAAVTPR